MLKDPRRVFIVILFFTVLAGYIDLPPMYHPIDQPSNVSGISTYIPVAIGLGAFGLILIAVIYLFLRLKKKVPLKAVETPKTTEPPKQEVPPVVSPAEIK